MRWTAAKQPREENVGELKVVDNEAVGMNRGRRHLVFPRQGQSRAVFEFQIPDRRKWVRVNFGHQSTRVRGTSGKSFIDILLNDEVIAENVKLEGRDRPSDFVLTPHILPDANRLEIRLRRGGTAAYWLGKIEITCGPVLER